jgi:hypothetical protein
MMASIARCLHDLILFGIVVLLFLGPVYLFASCRLRRARRRGEERAYLPHADPWLSAVLALTGVALIGLLRLIG